MSCIKESNNKNLTCYFFDDMFNMKNFDPSRIRIDKKSYKNIAIYYIGCMTIKILSYVKINTVNSLYLIIDKVDGYIEKSNRNKYLTLVFSGKNKDTLKKYMDLWDKIKDPIRSITITLGDHGEKYENQI